MILINRKQINPILIKQINMVLIKQMNHKKQMNCKKQMNHRKHVLITNHIKKWLKNINKILEYFACGKFINQKYFTLRLDNMIFWGFEYKPKKIF